MAKKVKKSVWLNYSVPFQGEIRGLYTWLDKNHAQECGANVAYFHYEVSEEEDLLEVVKSDLLQNYKTSIGDKLYIIWLDSPTSKVKGAFISGGRGKEPWMNYYVEGTQTIDEQNPCRHGFFHCITR